MGSRPTAVMAGVVALAVATVLSGCVGGGPSPDPSPTGVASPTPAHSPSPAPTATPSPAASPSPTAGAAPDWPAYDPADPNTWTIDFTGIGPFTLGDSFDQQVSAFTAFPREDCLNDAVASYDPPGLWFAASRDGSDAGTVALVSASSRRVGSEAAPGPHTDAGIRPGDTVSALLEAYPAIEVRQTNISPYYVLTDGTSWIHFVVYGASTVEELQGDDEIDTIVVSMLPVPPPEICG